MYLGIDCSGITASLSLLMLDGREIHACADAPRQADVIFPMLQKLLADAGIDTKQLAAVGAITGPGSFTGIRVGLSLAQGLADGLDIPAYGLDAFTALRGTAVDATLVLESKRTELYVQHNHNTQMLTPQEIMELGAKTILHNLSENSFLPPSPAMSMALTAAQHAKAQFESKRPPEILTPYYVRDADAKPNAA